MNKLKKYTIKNKPATYEIPKWYFFSHKIDFTKNAQTEFKKI